MKKTVKIISILLAAAFLLTGCTASYTSDSDKYYDLDSFSFKNMSYSEPNLTRFDELCTLIGETASGSIWKGFALNSYMNELFDIYYDFYVQYGLLELFTMQDFTNKTYADAYVKLTEEDPNVRDKMWKCVDAAVNGKAGWLFSELNDGPALLESFGGSYSERSYEQLEMDKLSVEEAKSVSAYEALSGELFCVDGNDFTFLYEIPEGAKTYGTIGEKENCWLVSEADIDNYLTQGYVTGETYDEMMYALYANKAQAYGAVLADLIETRNRLARLAGYSTYAEYAYTDLYLRDYKPEDLEAARNYVKKELVPLFYRFAGQIYGIPDDGSAEAICQDIFENKLFETVQPILRDISPTLEESFLRMKEMDAYDFRYSEKKMDVGFTMLLPVYNVPFIFIQPSVPAGVYEVQTFFHEFGHFNQYLTVEMTDRVSYDIDSTEVLSQGLELISTNYYGQLFNNKDSAQREMKLLIYNMLYTIIQGYLQDEFQQRIYTEKDLTVDRISQIYAEVRKEYQDNFYRPENGMSYSWLDIYHTFAAPFYYVSYATSALCAMQIWLSDEPVDNYFAFCEATADMGIVENCLALELSSPIEEACLSELADKLTEKFGIPA